MNIIIIVLGVMTTSFWSYCSVFYQHDRNLELLNEQRYLKYPQGYVVFGLLQWILIGFNLIWIFKWLGIIAFILSFVLAYFIAKFFYHKLFKFKPNTALALFGISFWLLFSATVIKLFIL